MPEQKESPSPRRTGEGQKARLEENIAGGILAVNLRAINTVFARPGYVLVESRAEPGLFQAIPDSVYSRGPRFGRAMLSELVVNGFGRGALLALEDAPAAVVAWVEWCYRQARVERAGRYPLSGLVARRGRVYGE